jgi:two-component system copper resistance phosphate regulon response regulator CusR
VDKPQLLVVEDHPATSRALRKLLELSGYRVDVAENVSSAIAANRAAKFDLLICDLNLPDGTGWELIETLRRDGSVRAVAFSAYDDAAHIAQSRAAGFIEHIVKTGTDPDVLLQTVERALKAAPAAGVGVAA